MIPGERLARWLADARRQRRTMDAVERFGRRFRESAPFETLTRRLDALAEPPAEAILALARDFIEEDAVTDGCVDDMIAAARADPFFRPGLRNASTEMVSGLWLLDHPRLALFLSLMPVAALAAKRSFRRGAASIAFTGQRSLYRFLDAGGATISLWEAPEILADFSLADSGRCRRIERRRLRDRETLEVDGRRRGFVIDRAVSDIVYVQALTPAGAAPLMAEYDSETHRCVGASSTDEAGSRIQLMLALLRTMDRTDALPLFEQMLAGPHFYARWQVMREFLGLDAESALPHLRRMAAADPHREVRAAAARTLSAFFDEEAQAVEEGQPCPA